MVTPLGGGIRRWVAGLEEAPQETADRDLVDQHHQPLHLLPFSLVHGLVGSSRGPGTPHFVVLHRFLAPLLPQVLEVTLSPGQQLRVLDVRSPEIRVKMGRIELVISVSLCVVRVESVGVVREVYRLVGGVGKSAAGEPTGCMVSGRRVGCGGVVSWRRVGCGGLVSWRRVGCGGVLGTEGLRFHTHTRLLV